MTLLEKYLKSVKMFLPREQRKDILDELSENLLSKIEEREAKLGRTLTELEQEALLRDHGDPMEVASRYGSTQRCVSFGRQLIGPALYPIYILVLQLNWGCTILFHVCFAIFAKPLGPAPFLIAVSGQFVAITLVFIIVDFYYRNLWPSRSFHVWYLNPAPRMAIAVGLIFWILYTLWWATVPLFPSMMSIISNDLKLAPLWPTLYFLGLVLFGAGVAQRVVHLIRPDWNWLIPPVRLVINIVSLSVLFFFPEGYWHLFPIHSMESTAALAKPVFMHNPLTYNLFLICIVFWAINAGVNTWRLIAYIRFRQRLRQNRTASAG